jgi:hypothetical protein
VTLIKEQVKMENFKAVLMVGLGTLGLSFDASAAASVNEAYGQCKAEVREKFGSDTRIKMKGSKKYKGTLTVKLSVVPDGASRQRVLCKVADGAFVLTDKEGAPLS